MTATATPQSSQVRSADATPEQVPAPPTSLLGRRPIIGEAVTLALLALMSLAYARPLVEEWIVLDWFDDHGIGGYKSFAELSPLRPLGASPTVLQWLLGGGHWGFGLGFAVMLAAQYFAARWAVSPMLSGRTRWLVSTAATVLLPWPGEWLQRYGAAHLSVVFLWLALGAAVRSPRASGMRRLGYVLGGALALLLLFCSYQSLAVCILALPLVALAVCPLPVGAGWHSRVALRRYGWDWALPVAGAVGYLAYSKVIGILVSTPSYEDGIINTKAQLHSLGGIKSLVLTMYDTAYVESPLTLAALVFLLAATVGPGLLAVESVTERRWAVALMAVALALLPLLGAPLAANTSFLKDSQHVLLPMAVGFVLLLFAGLVRYPPPGRWSAAGTVATTLIAILLLSTAVSGYSARRESRVEESVIAQTKTLLQRNAATSVIIWDYTGRLGDVYSLFDYQHTLQLALRANDVPTAQAIICTPNGVDRLHPYAETWGWASTARCEGLATPPKTLKLNALPGGSVPTLVAVP